MTGAVPDEEPSPDELAAMNAAADSSHEAAPAPAPKRKTKPKPALEYPQSADSEKGILSSILLAPDDVLDLCAEKGVTRDTFYLQAHGTIYQALIDTREAKKPVVFITVAQLLRDRGELENIGGAPYLNELTVFLPSAANVLAYIDECLKKHWLRRLLAQGERVKQRVMEEPENVIEILNDYERDALSVRGDQAEDDDRPIKPVVFRAIDGMQERWSKGSLISGLSWGLPTLDLATDGLVKGEFAILAGLPASGKTSLLRQAMLYIAENQGAVGIWNLEMSDEQLAEAWIYHIARINPIEFRQRGPSEFEMKEMANAAARLAKLPLWLKGRPGMSIQSFQASVRRMVRRKGIVVAAVDSATQMTSESQRAHKRYEDVIDLGPGFKAAAKDNNVPVVVLWHLGSKFEERLSKDDNAIPVYSDLEGGAAGSRNSDKFCALVRRPEFHEFVTVKQRMGEPVTKTPLVFDGRYTRFSEPVKEPTQSEMGI